MSEQAPIRDGQILIGALFSEPMRVETVRPNGTGSWQCRDDGGCIGTNEPETCSTDRSGRIMTLVVPLTGRQS